MKRLIVLLALLTIAPATVTATPDTSARQTEVVVQTGLIQSTLLRGGNVELDVFVGRLVFGYSHGFKLKLEDSTVVGDASDQGLAFELPFSTGLSVGYLVLDWLDIRAEFKWHRFDVHYDDAKGIPGGDIFSYDTFTVGAGVYAHWRPWKHRAGWMKGWNASASLRFWPNVATTLDGGERDYDNTFLGERVTHKAANIGIANTPFIGNVSVGYAFDL